MEFQVVREVRDRDEDDEIVKNFADDLPEKFSALNLNYSVPRSSGMSERGRGENNSQEPINPQQHVLDVAPLNSKPYIGPPGDINSTPTKGETEAVERVGPAMIFFPSHSPREEWEKLTASMQSGVALTGSALGEVAPLIRLMTIAESEDTYYFRVSLPGVSRDEKDFSCDIEPDGKVLIKGITTTGEKIVCKNSQVFRMLTQNLCAPGHFSMSFHLPGPVEHQQFSGHLLNGILEGIVKKKK